MRHKSKKFMAFVLSMAMILSNVSLSSTTSYAEDNTTTSEITSEATTVDNTNTEDETVETTTEEVTTENTTQSTSEDVQVLDQDELNDLLEQEGISTEDLTEDDSEEDTTEETTTENSTTEETTKEEITVDASKLAYRLIVGTSDKDILTNGAIISNMEDLYIIGYLTEEDRENGINFYTDKVDFVEKDDYIFQDADNTTNEDDLASNTDGVNTNTISDDTNIVVTNPNDSFTNYEELTNDTESIEEVQDISKKDTIIAVIDSGVSKDQLKTDNIVNAVSVIGDSEIDDYGHGTSMIDTILSENPDAKILSIKALNEEGKASASDIYTAIRYAIDNHVDIINLSLSAYYTEENSIVKDIINEAIDNEIIVNGAAGNKGKDAKYFIPSCIENANIIGAMSTNYTPLDTNNTGLLIDYFVIGNSTSEATARFTGIVSKYGLDDIKNHKKINDDIVIMYNVESIDDAAAIDFDIQMDDDTEFSADWITLDNVNYPDKVVLKNVKITSADWSQGYLYTQHLGNGTWTCGTLFNATCGEIKLYNGNTEITGTERQKYTVSNLKFFCTYQSKGTPVSGTINEMTLTRDPGQDQSSYIRSNYAVLYSAGNYTTNLGNGYQTVGAKIWVSTSPDVMLSIKKSNKYGLDMTGIVYGLFDTTGNRPVLYFMLDAMGYPYVIYETQYTNNSDFYFYFKQRIVDHYTVTGPNSTRSGDFLWAQFGFKSGHTELGTGTFYFAEISPTATASQCKVQFGSKLPGTNVTFNNSSGYANLVTNTNGVAIPTIINGQTELVTTSDETPPVKGMIQIVKVDQNNNFIDGAEYTLYSDANCTKKVPSSKYDSSSIQTNPITTHDGGFAAWTGLDNGTYYVKETKAPSGYTIDSTVYTVNINTSWTCNGTVYPDTSIANLSYTYDDRYYRNTFGDTVQQKYTGNDGSSLMFTHYAGYNYTKLYGLKQGRVASRLFNPRQYYTNYKSSLNSGLSLNSTMKNTSWNQNNYKTSEETAINNAGDGWQKIIKNYANSGAQQGRKGLSDDEYIAMKSKRVYYAHDDASNVTGHPVSGSTAAGAAALIKSQDTHKSKYYIVVEKRDADTGYGLKMVPFDLKFKLENESNYRVAVTGYNYSEDELYGVWTGHYSEFRNADAGTGRLVVDTAPLYLNGDNTQQHGFAIVYLGEYDTPPEDIQLIERWYNATDSTGISRGLDKMSQSGIGAISAYANGKAWVVDNTTQQRIKVNDKFAIAWSTNYVNRANGKNIVNISKTFSSKEDAIAYIKNKNYKLPNALVLKNNTTGVIAAFDKLNQNDELIANAKFRLYGVKADTEAHARAIADDPYDENGAFDGSSKEGYISCTRLDDNHVFTVNPLGDTSDDEANNNTISLITNGDEPIVLNLRHYYDADAANKPGKYQAFFIMEEEAPDGYMISKKSSRLILKAVADYSEDDMTSYDVTHVKHYNSQPVSIAVIKQIMGQSYDTIKNNPNYSLEGTCFFVFKSEPDASLIANIQSQSNATNANNLIKNSDSYIGKINLNTNDIANNEILTIDDPKKLNIASDGTLNDTTFYVIEYIPPTIKGYYKNTEVYPVTVTKDNTEDNPAIVNITNKPVQDPFSISLEKHDLYTGETGIDLLPKGLSFKNTKIKLDFYGKDITQNYSQAYLESHFTPDQTLYIFTNDNGEASTNKYEEFPLGYIVISEVDPPSGYSGDAIYKFHQNNTTPDVDITDNRSFILDYDYDQDKPLFKLAQNGTTLGYQVFNSASLELFDPPIRKDILVHKVKKNEGNYTDLRGIQFRIDMLDSSNHVVESHTITTNADGIATTENGGRDTWFSTTNDSTGTYAYNQTQVDTYDLGSLPVGHYRLTEIYNPNKNGDLQLLAPLDFEITGEESQKVVVISEYGDRLVNIPDPEISTRSSVTSTNSKQAPYTQSFNLTDYITIDRLRYNTTYFVEGTLMVVYPNGDTKAYPTDNNPYKATTSFTTKTRPANSESEFEVKQENVPLQYNNIVLGSSYEGCKLVCYVKLYYGSSATNAQYPEYAGTDKIIFPLVQDDITNTDETVYVPKIRTHAWVNENGTPVKALRGETEEQVYDILEYENLLPNTTYTVSGELLYSNKHATDTSWHSQYGDTTVTFTTPAATGNAKTVSGTKDNRNQDVKVLFTVNGQQLAGSDIVIYETLQLNGITVAEHKDKNDPEQQLASTAVLTNAIDDNTNLQVAKDGTTIFTDRVDLIGLEVGKKYKLAGQLYDANSNPNNPTPIKNAQGADIKDEIEFTATSDSYELKKNTAKEMHYPIDVTNMHGKTIVVFETLYKMNDDGITWDPKPVAEHKQIGDLKQMVHIPNFSTRAIDSKTGLVNEGLVEYSTTAKVIDYIDYENLVPNNTYYIKGNLHEKNNPTNIIAKYELTDNKTFTPTGTNSSVGVSDSVPVEFIFDSTRYSGKTLVAQEELYVKVNNEFIKIDEHVSDTYTTQTVRVADVTTSVVSDNGTKYADIDGIHTFTDTVSYSNLVGGKNYEVEGKLYYNNDNPEELRGQPVKDANGNDYKKTETFAASASGTGTTTVTYSVDTAPLVGRHIVVYEDIYYVNNGVRVLVARHNSINDKEQTFFITSIKTHATDNDTKIHVAKNGQITLTDKVEVAGLYVGDKYRIRGRLMNANSDPNDPDPIVNANGQPIKSTYPTNTTEFNTNGFTAEFIRYDETTHFIEIPYSLDVTNMDGTTIVVFEVLEHWNNEDNVWEVAAEHENIADIEQMVHVPAMSTSAKDSLTGLEEPTLVSYGETAKVTDTLHYSNLVPNQEYYIEGNIHEKNNASKVIATVALTDAKTFTPEGEESAVGVSGDIPVDFIFNSTKLNGKTLVIYEKLFVKVNDTFVEVADHTSEIDEKQTIKVANVATLVKEKTTGSKYADSDGIHTFTDKVTYSNIIPGQKYRIKGQLYYNNDNPEGVKGLPVKDADGHDYTQTSGVFEAEADSEFKNLDYTIDTEPLAGRHIVVFEDLYLVKDENDESKDVLIASHHDIDDKEQTFFIVDIKTHATDNDTKIHVAKNGQITLIDQVEIKGLTVNDTYRIKGILMDANSNENNPTAISTSTSTTVTSTYPNNNGFKAAHMNYNDTTEFISVPYELDVTNMDGTTIVVYETLEHKLPDNTWEVVAEHKDLKDIEQMVHVPVMSTSAKDSATLLTNPTLAEYSNTAKVTDTLSYSNLVPNQEYYIEGNIHEKGNASNIIAKVELTDNKTFTPTGEESSVGVSGTENVEFTFDSTKLDGKTLVVFEKLYVKVGTKFVEVADHTSELDTNQTIKVARVRTRVLSDQNTKYADSDGMHTFTDTVHYSNVVAGKKYLIKGILYYNNDNPDDIKGTPVLDAEGNPYTCQSEIFTAPDSGEDDVLMNYTIDTEPLAGRHIVVYEDLYLVKDENDRTKDVHIAKHNKIDDYAQTFFIVNIKTKATDDNTNINVTMNGITTITDTVDYKGLDKNKNYIICGTLMERIVDATTGEVSYEPFKREDGTVYTADSGVFNSGNAINGTKYVKFVVNPTVLETDKTIVIFEKLYYIDEDHDDTRIEIAKHENINDIIQMAHIPHIHTLAMDKGTKLTDPTMTTYGESIDVVDTVSYHNLLPNIEYTIKGELFELVPIVKDDETNSDDNNDDTNIDNTDNTDNNDQNDDDQNNADDQNNDDANDDQNNDDQNDNNDDNEADDENVDEEVEMQIVSTGIVSETTFTPKTTDEGVIPNVVVVDGEETNIVTIDGTCPITFTFDSTQYADRTFVVYERLYLTNTETNELVEIADHTDINDTKQTIHIPKITTEATDSITGLHLGELREHITMDDDVSYTNVVPNNFYQVKGILMNKDTNEPYLDKNGEEVIAYSEVFVPKTAEGHINVHYDFNIDLDELPTDKDKESLNLRLVVFEELYLVNDPSIEVEDEDDTDNNGDDTNNDQNDDQNDDQNNDQNNDQNSDANNENVDNNDNTTNGNQPINLDNDDQNDDLNNDDLNNDDDQNNDANNDDQNDDNNDTNDDNNDDIIETPVTQAQIDSANEIINSEFTEDAEANLEVQKKINAYADEYGLPEDLYNKDAEFTEEVFNAIKNYLTNFVEDAEVVDVDMTKPAKPIALVAIHKDIDDEGQTVNFTTIRTTLTGIPEKEVHETKADEEIELVDYVYYHNLLVGKTYTISGILMKKPKTEDEEPTALLDKDGNEITATSEPFTINSEEEVNGVIPITFKFDGSLLKGETTVAYEELYQDDIYVTSHKDITDEDQTVHMPKIGTMAFNSDTDLQTAPVDLKVNITDTVMFDNLVYGSTYVLTGSLIDKETGEVLKDNNGKDIVATQTFTVSEEDKNVTIEEIFANDGLPYEESTDVEDTDVEDIDEDENIDETDTEDTDNTDDENAEDMDGNEVDEETVKVIRTKTHASGKVNVEFKNINTLNLAGKDTVVFEVLVNKDTKDEVADHKDKDDKDQNIKFPTVHTTALDKVDGDKLLDCRENTHTIVDTVHYTNLIPGKEYTLKAKVAIKPKNKSDKINFVTLKDKETYVTHTFIPDKAEGDEKVEITFDTSEYVTNNHLVVFEDLYYDDVLLYMHADIDDEDQTIFLGMQLEVQIGKADKDNIKYYLKDAEITIFNKDGTVAKDINGKECIGLTDKDGQVKFNVVYDPDNTYYAQETKAPKGYNINPDKFELKPTGEKNKLGADVIKITILDSIIIIPPKTPKTSDIINIALILALIGLGACGILVFRKRKKNR